ncbi:MAG TPA: hypothetical protein VHF69_00245 [Candidatus Synoicihabitans sp.]|nr:hypothetical protein [Candidatus Synoicihabitans sp.]
MVGAFVGLVATSRSGATAPYPPSPVVADVELDWTTHRREAPGSDNWQLTWADDDQLYGFWGDGGGLGGTNDQGRVGLGFGRIEGGWQDYRGTNVWGGVDAANPAQFAGKSWGTISVDGVLYAWIVPDHPDPAVLGGGKEAAEAWPRDHYRYIFLARSTDRGATWTRASWRWWREDDLTIPTFLNFGRDNAGARDAYVYSYFVRPERPDVTQGNFGLSVHRPGVLFLARARHDQLFDGRDAYEWFTGLVDGQPQWGPLSAKRPVFEDPAGAGWSVSASHAPGINRYLLATEHETSSSGALGLFDAPEPWGPWTTVKYWTVEEPFGAQRPGSTLPWKHNVFFFSFVPKWWSADGREFTLLFTGAGKGLDNDSLNTIRGRFVLREPRAATPHAR